MTGLAARPFPAVLAHRANSATCYTAEDKPSSVCLSSCFSAVSGVRLGRENGRNCSTGSRTQDGDELYARGVVVARIGGGFRSSPGGSRRQRVNRPPRQDIDPALDMDRIKAPSVRLIDKEQNMVGIVNTSQSIQMARDAGLDLQIQV